MTLTDRCTIHCGYRPDVGPGETHCANCHDRREGYEVCLGGGYVPDFGEEGPDLPDPPA